MQLYALPTRCLEALGVESMPVHFVKHLTHSGWQAPRSCKAPGLLNGAHQWCSTAWSTEFNSCTFLAVERELLTQSRLLAGPDAEEETADYWLEEP